MTRAFWRAAPVAAAAAIATAALFLVRPDCLTVRDSAGRIAAVFVLRAADPAFSLSWIHSVMLLPCKEYFRRGEGGTIELYRTEYKGLGAGLPSGDEGGRVTLKDGWIIIDGMSRSFPSITLFTTPIAPHLLGVGGREYPVLELLGTGHKAVFSIERIPLGELALARAGLH